ncbi:MAG: hypothetical protein ABI670_01230 [Chloroflexota bacterium]
MDRREAEELRRRIEVETDCRVLGMSDRDSQGPGGVYLKVVFPGGATYDVESPEQFEELLRRHQR